MAWTEKFCRADAAGGGDGSTDTNSGGSGAWTLAEAVTNEAAGMRINVRAGTYANTTTTRTFAAVGTTTAPIWWRGFNATPGDIDLDQSLAKPEITFTTGAFSTTGAHHVFSNLNVSGATTSGPLGINSSTGGSILIDRCRFTNAGVNANSRAYTANGLAVIARSYFQATSTASAVMIVGNEATVLDCTFTGGGVGISHTGGTGVFRGNVIRGTGSHGYELASAPSRPAVLLGSTIYNSGGDGIRFTALPSSGLIADNLIANSAGYGINNPSGTPTNIVKRINNDFYSNTSGNENGFGDSPSLSEQAESASPWVNAAAGDFTLATLAVAKAKASPYPGPFENQDYTSYRDIGAVQSQGAGGSSAAISPSPISANSWHNIG